MEKVYDMKKTLKILSLLIGLFIFIYGTLFSIISNFNIGNLMVLATGLFFILFGTLWDKFPNNKIIKTLKITVYAGFIFLFSTMIFIFISSKTNPADFTEDAVIVLGTAVHGERPSTPLILRLEKCIEYTKKNPKAIIIVSGGQGAQEDVTEAYAMKKYLTKKGIKAENIIEEDKATSTNENFKYSKIILDNYFNKNYKVAYITNDFHSYRSYKLAKLNGINALSYNTNTNITAVLPSYMREVLALIQLYIFKR